MLGTANVLYRSQKKARKLDLCRKIDLFSYCDATQAKPSAECNDGLITGCNATLNFGVSFFWQSLPLHIVTFLSLKEIRRGTVMFSSQVFLIYVDTQESFLEYIAMWIRE